MTAKVKGKSRVLLVQQVVIEEYGSAPDLTYTTLQFQELLIVLYKKPKLGHN